MSVTCCSCFVATMRQRGLFGPGRTTGLRRRNSSHAGGAPYNAANRNAFPSYSSRLPNLASQMRTALASMASNTASSSPGEREMTRSTSDDAVCCSTASTRCSHAFASARVRASSFFSNSRACDASFFSSSVRGSRSRPTRVLAFVPLERSLRPCVRLFAPLRDKVTSLARRSTQAPHAPAPTA